MSRSVSVARWLIQHAARKAPGCLAARLEEEWLADLESRDSHRSKLSHAIGCQWAAWGLVHDEPRRAAPPPIWVGRGVTLSGQELSYFSLRSGTVFLIVGLHAALCC